MKKDGRVSAVSESMPSAARDQTMLRRANELTVLAVLRDGTSRVMREIADETGLSWRTANVVTESLEAHGWLASEADTNGKRLGRPARRYRFRADVGHVAGIDIAAHAISVFIADLAGTIVGRHQVSVSPGDAAADRLATAEATLRAALSTARLDGTGVWAAAVGSTGIIGPDGVVSKSAVLPGWTGVDPGARLAHLLRCPVSVTNDCNLAVLAERWHGHRADTMIYLLTGVRLGTGLVIGGQLHRGSAGAAGEIGEIREFGWHDAAERLAAAAPGPVSDLDRAAAQVFAAARDGDAGCLRAVEQFSTDVARGLTAMVLTIDPDLVVIGGGFAHAADLLLPRLRQRLAGTCPHTPRLEASELGDESVGLGAVRLALDTIDQRITALDSATPLTPAAISGTS
ncbi:transcriptional regulator [Sphaerisporangium krabiense]|uniref:Putative NBD/HSP70 family sugar kinase n=1 Tax=Sphaerisporangium krabiense TaxID=763782 RepID=A0A7W9DN69_9ACTN|nr:ROK family protein [Sphaerisporangium krabiense]MBB5625057.1 putative NBD/HSP70 family sugar kinase [Sphaerisporangium krabiense]GII67511.1 transcriptional regulator [Sphaerisporangium krabiense]